ncbi:four-helix bundle copper-binding protein [Pseudomonas sp. SP16.1]|uniref:four-helix bundle copper-binding protein n=1 Tax=Pseudomonas sp. SP16.1 TaxID=3458854 RepID=UPI004046864F
MHNSNFESCIKACLDCAVACDHCFGACLSEQQVQMMVRCIQLDRECSEVCRLAACLMASGSESASAFGKVCADICRKCGEECAKHEAEHCQQCAKACMSCAEECSRMAA